MKKILTIALFGLIVLAQANLGHGAGFLIYEHGAAAMAMAGAFVSVADDPSAIWHNPAGIAFLKGTQFSLGTTLIWSGATMELPNWPVPSQRNWNQVEQMFYPSNFYFTQSLSKRVTLGLGFFSPFGLGAEWPAENPLRYLGYKDDMKTFFFNPTIAYKLSDQFSFGLGFSYIYSTVLFKLVEIADLTDYNAGVWDVPASLEGSGDSFNFNAGLLYKGDQVNFGVSFRSGFNIKYSGDLTLTTSALPAPFNALFPSTAKGETTFKFPGILSFGFSVNASKRLLLSADANYVIWSRFDEYVVTFDNPELAELNIAENFKDSWTFRVGLQYKATDKLALRGGFLYDLTPQPIETMDPLLPDTDRYAFTVGVGYTFGKVILDATYHHEVFLERTAPNRYLYQFANINLGEGIYNTSADLVGISLSFVF